MPAKGAAKGPGYLELGVEVGDAVVGGEAVDVDGEGAPRVLVHDEVDAEQRQSRALPERADGRRHLLLRRKDRLHGTALLLRIKLRWSQVGGGMRQMKTWLRPWEQPCLVSW